jgi:hypothetical protein
MKMFDALKRKVNDWTGVTLLRAELEALRHSHRDLSVRLNSYVEAGVDVSFKGNTRIIVTSRLDGGRVQIYDLHFKDIRAMMGRMADILGPEWPNCVIDAPPDIKRAFRDYGMRP